MTRQYTYVNYMITKNEWISPTIMNLFSFFFWIQKVSTKKNKNCFPTLVLGSNLSWKIAPAWVTKCWRVRAAANLAYK